MSTADERAEWRDDAKHWRTEDDLRRILVLLDEVERLREGLEAAADSLSRWNGDDGSLVVATNIRHLRALLDEGERG